MAVTATQRAALTNNAHHALMVQPRFMTPNAAAKRLNRAPATVLGLVAKGMLTIEMVETAGEPQMVIEIASIERYEATLSAEAAA